MVYWKCPSYDGESWNMNEHVKEKVEVIEMRFLRRLMEMPWASNYQRLTGTDP